MVRSARPSSPAWRIGKRSDGFAQAKNAPIRVDSVRLFLGECALSRWRLNGPESMLYHTDEIPNIFICDCSAFSKLARYYSFDTRYE